MAHRAYTHTNTPFNDLPRPRPGRTPRVRQISSRRPGVRQISSRRPVQRYRSPAELERGYIDQQENPGYTDVTGTSPSGGGHSGYGSFVGLDPLIDGALTDRWEPGT